MTSKNIKLYRNKRNSSLNVEGMFFITNKTTIEKYGDVEEFNLDTTGLNIESIEMFNYEAINNSNADVIYLESVGNELQVILKNKGLDKYNLKG